MERRFRSEREGRMQGHPLSVLDGSCARRASGSRGAGHTPNIHTECSAAHEHEEAEKYSRTRRAALSWRVTNHITSELPTLGLVGARLHELGAAQLVTRLSLSSIDGSHIIDEPCRRHNHPPCTTFPTHKRTHAHPRDEPRSPPVLNRTGTSTSSPRCLFTGTGKRYRNGPARHGPARQGPLAAFPPAPRHPEPAPDGGTRPLCTFAITTPIASLRQPAATAARATD